MQRSNSRDSGLRSDDELRVRVVRAGALSTDAASLSAAPHANPFDRLKALNARAHELALHAERVAMNFDGIDNPVLANDSLPPDAPGALGALEAATEGIASALRDIHTMLDRINRHLP